ncbi:hypothetical protein J1605_002279 [Eschrichtius robustus]|uniref:Uncharacterized protein n=1 Tax=Eschrichtius robustus TaxID=9764 RepID=A0AB34HYB6_ESCRO|nr:hypothetical protein J1605_002279 [Eschrichtius robustus]
MEASSERELYGGGDCSSDSFELRVSGQSRLLPPPSLPLFCFPFPSPSLPCPRRPDPEEAAAVAAAEFSVKSLRCQAAQVESEIAEEGASRFSASSGGGGSRGAPQHYPKTAGNSEFLGRTPGQNAQKRMDSCTKR